MFKPMFSKQNWLHNFLFEQHSKIGWNMLGSVALKQQPQTFWAHDPCKKVRTSKSFVLINYVLINFI